MVVVVRIGVISGSMLNCLECWCRMVCSGLIVISSVLIEVMFVGLENRVKVLMM